MLWLKKKKSLLYCCERRREEEFADEYISCSVIVEKMVNNV